MKLNSTKQKFYLLSSLSRIVLCVLFLTLSYSNINGASSLFDYHIRIHQSAMEISLLLGEVEEEIGYRAYQARVDSALYNVRAMLPASETVEWDKKKIEVNNSWLHREIADFYNLQSYDKKREDILLRLEDRLNALDARLTEVDGKIITTEESSTRFPVGENPNKPSSQPTTIDETVTLSQNGSQNGSVNQNQTPQSSTTATANQTQTQPSNDAGQNTNKRDKEAEKAKLNEILHRDEYSKKPPQESAIERFFNWLFKREPKKEAPREAKPVTPLVMIVQYLVIGIAFAAIAFVLWKLVPRFLRRERKAKKEKRKPRVILGERLEEDQTSADLLAEADKLARAGDIRGAIRKGYIALLCELGDRQTLSLSQYKTNRDYLRDVRTRIMLYAAMEQMTNSFERHWYGFQPTNENDWINFRNYYQQAIKN